MGPIPLANRAVHLHFLKKLAAEKVGTTGATLGDLTTAEFVKVYIKPATSHARASFAESILSKVPLPSQYSLSWCTTAGTIRDIDGTVQQAFGQTRFFASHAWSYKFGDLVSMLDNHYSQLPGSRGGARYLPIFYWVDVIAVTQHFTGDFKDHPDSDFQSVIRSSKAVLFTMHPWRSPIAPTRVWCLFEALTAIEAQGVQLEVIVDVKDSKDTRVQTVQVISNSIDVRTAQASVSSDRIYIIGCIESGLGVTAFNNVMRKRLREALLQAVTPNAVEVGDTAAVHELLKAGGCVRPDGILDLPALFKFAGEPEMLSVLRSIHVRDLRPRGLVLSGRQRTKEMALTDAGLRGWDGESFSLREYSEVETGRVTWPYMPTSPAVCQAVAELLVMAPGSSSSSGSSGMASATSSSQPARALEELWISLRAPKVDDGPKDSPTRGGPGPGLGPGSLSGISEGPGSATAARAHARAVAASPARRRISGGGMTTIASLGSSLAPNSPSGTVRSGSGVSPAARRSINGTSAGSTGVRTSTSSPVPVASMRSSLSGVGTLGDGLLSATHLQQEGRVALPVGRPALWVAVGASRTLRMLCLHQAVLGPQDLQQLKSALHSNKVLEMLQAVKCVPAGSEGKLAGGVARLSAELLVVGLGAGGLRQLHIQPGDLTYVAEFHQLTTPAHSLLRRVTLSPVALSPTAVRQLGDALAALPYLDSCVIGMDPAPPVTWMPKDPYEREHWLVHEEKNEPEMAAKRRRFLGLDDMGMAVYVANAWDFREELGTLPDPTPGRSAHVRQRAAALSFFLCLSCGWRDMSLYARQYGRWWWAKRCQQDDGLTELKNNLEAYKTLAADLLKAAPDTFACKFNKAEQQKRCARSRLQVAFWAAYG